ncbi:cytochrome c nitrite reductase pentaheme subunit [Vibrio sp. CAU 1672]|uniref:cytochrome c nitrite reductase pentaheme subunit n=1 Tax=Vibrio sp. CAU 1672 TaxID=3032594 RepID=UPI0023DAA531|nr:cytochrome c nitrite reductase pentaheme subunit [Vibrio sp. CAU 1672]MDF2154297.1 cytochrome c nitrite reductase pentaheme subunit [Vibrio sp. CAU 1672]
MGNIKLTIETMLKFLFVFAVYGFSIAAHATPSEPADGAQAERHQVELIRDRDYKCLQCHKESKQTLGQSHDPQVLLSKGQVLNCTNCHSNIGPDHREGAPEVIKFSAAQSKAVHGKAWLDPTLILKANSQCVDCHAPTQQRESHWTHDVHAKNLTCSNCHDVHAKKTKALSYDSKQLIKQCVDCHSEFAKEEER